MMSKISDFSLQARLSLIRVLKEQNCPSPSEYENAHPLGWDDTTLDNFLKADRIQLTLPHASPNVFFPRAGVAWYAQTRQQLDPALFHLRVVLTHNNFGDLGWRPYAWWHLNAEGHLKRLTCFTRNKRMKHVVVMSQPPLHSIPDSMHGIDLLAARFASQGQNLGDSFIRIMAIVERAAGVNLPGRTLYVPLNLAIACAKKIAEEATAPGRKLEAMLSCMPGRSLNALGELQSAADWRKALVFDNPGNIALMAIFGDQHVIGGAKMKAYWPEVRARLNLGEGFLGQLQVADYPSSNRIETLLKPNEHLLNVLSEMGISYSQGMAIWEHGNFADRHHPFSI